MSKRRLVAQNLIEIIADSGMTQAEVARRVVPEITRGYLNRILNDKISPTTPTLLAILRALFPGRGDEECLSLFANYGADGDKDGRTVKLYEKALRLIANEKLSCEDCHFNETPKCQADVDCEWEKVKTLLENLPG